MVKKRGWMQKTHRGIFLSQLMSSTHHQHGKYSWQCWSWKPLGCALTPCASAEARIVVICSHKITVVGLLQPEPLLHQPEVSGNDLPASALEWGIWRENTVWRLPGCSSSSFVATALWGPLGISTNAARPEAKTLCKGYLLPKCPSFVFSFLITWFPVKSAPRCDLSGALFAPGSFLGAPSSMGSPLAMPSTPSAVNPDKLHFRLKDNVDL